jgi:hypothetical protein
MNDIINQIAKNHGVTPQEVEQEIQEALLIAMQNPEAQEFWCEVGDIFPSISSFSTSF